MIDKISVEMLVHDNQIDIFPFVIEMDRYKAAVSGVQKLDMNFDYHISVLKSPIPFRLGIDIYGNPDKFKFRICRARYKSVDVPSYVEVIDSARLNLRKNITDIFRRGVEAATLSHLRVNSSSALPSEVTADSEQLTAEDSVLLQKEGFLPGADTTQMPIDTLQSVSTESPVSEVVEPSIEQNSLPVEPDKKSKRKRRSQQQLDAVLPEEQQK